MNNYEFCADFALDASKGRTDFKVLDYGCGAGEIVAAMRRNDLDAYGCDPYYAGGNSQDHVPREVADRIFRMQGDRVPFRDSTFDLVVTNTVLEHVDDLDVTVAEIARVLKPGGSCLAIFPHLEVWREGHCEIPFVHRMPNSALRIHYAAAMRWLGLGVHRKDLPPYAWARNFYDWHDKYCRYRPLKTIRATFRRHLSAPRHIEATWAAKRSSLLARLPAPLRVLIARKAAGLVFVVDKATV
jgi:SAM-dependent methyltransferase